MKIFLVAHNPATRVELDEVLRLLGHQTYASDKLVDIQACQVLVLAADTDNYDIRTPRDTVGASLCAGYALGVGLPLVIHSSCVCDSLEHPQITRVKTLTELHTALQSLESRLSS